MAGIILGVIAILVSVVAVLYSRDAARSSARSAKVAEDADRRARTPRLVIETDNPAPAGVDRVIYRVRNDGPQDLDSVVMYRPRPRDGIAYPIAVTGGVVGFAEDEIELGPVAMAQEARFTLCCGVATEVPEFRVRIECRAGTDRWELTELLPAARLR